MSNIFPKRLRSPRQKDKGVALVIVLAFVVLLTGVIIAFFSRSLTGRQISNSSANQTKAALFAQGASDTVIANLQQEIVLSSSANSIVTGAATSVIYTPNTTPPVMLPQLSVGLSSTAANLLIRSANNQNIYTGLPGNAVASSSLTPQSMGVTFRWRAGIRTISFPWRMRPIPRRQLEASLRQTGSSWREAGPTR